MCIDMYIDMRIGMCTDMCTDTCTHMFTEMCTGMCVGTSTDVCMDIYIGMCMDMCIDMWSHSLHRRDPSMREWAHRASMTSMALYRLCIGISDGSISAPHPRADDSTSALSRLAVAYRHRRRLYYRLHTCIAATLDAGIARRASRMSSLPCCSCSQSSTTDDSFWHISYGILVMAY